MPSEKKISLKYVGPADMSSPDVQADTEGPAMLVPGETYELSESVAERLLASTDYFEKSGSGKAKKSADESDPDDDDKE